jgi:SH3-like domain-containing protein
VALQKNKMMLFFKKYKFKILLTMFFAVAFIITNASVNRAIANSGLEVPRFVSFGSNKTNMRVGPGIKYPIKWVYHRRHLPVLVIAEFSHWRKVMDYTGEEGWVHKNLLNGKRTFIMHKENAILRKSAKNDSMPVARLSKGIVGFLGKCLSNWCEATINNFEGWLKTDDIWGYCIPQKINNSYNNKC